MAGAALVLLFPPIALGVGTGRLLDAYRDGPLDDRLVFILVTALLAGVLANLGTIVYAGVLEELVGSVIRGGGRRPSIGEAVRSLPIWRLIGADLAASALVGLASALGVLPGFLLIAMLGIVGPVVNIERGATVRGDPPLPRPDVAAPVAHLAHDRAAARLVEIAAHHWLLHVRHEADVRRGGDRLRAADPDRGCLRRPHRGRARVRAAGARRRVLGGHGRSRDGAARSAPGYRVIASAKLSKFST